MASNVGQVITACLISADLGRTFELPEGGASYIGAHSQALPTRLAAMKKEEETGERVFTMSRDPGVLWSKRVKAARATSAETLERGRSRLAVTAVATKLALERSCIFRDLASGGKYGSTRSLRLSKLEERVEDPRLFEDSKLKGTAKPFDVKEL